MNSKMCTLVYNHSIFVFHLSILLHALLGSRPVAAVKDAKWKKKYGCRVLNMLVPLQMCHTTIHTPPPPPPSPPPPPPLRVENVCLGLYTKR